MRQRLGVIKYLCACAGNTPQGDDNNKRERERRPPPPLSRVGGKIIDCSSPRGWRALTTATAGEAVAAAAPRASCSWGRDEEVRRRKARCRVWDADGRVCMSTCLRRLPCQIDPSARGPLLPTLGRALAQRFRAAIGLWQSARGGAAAASFIIAPSLLVARSSAGKSSIERVVFGKMSPHETLFLEVRRSFDRPICARASPA